MKSAVVVGTGPSLTIEDCELLRPWQNSDRIVIAVNLAYRMAPFCDHVYATDLHWWSLYRDEVNAECPLAWRWSVNAVANIRKVVDQHDAGSGAKAIRLACTELEAQRIAVIGFDGGPDESGKTHFFGDYPPPLVNHADFGGATKPMYPVPVTNCSRRTRLKWFPTMPLEDWLE